MSAKNSATAITNDAIGVAQPRRYPQPLVLRPPSNSTAALAAGSATSSQVRWKTPVGGAYAGACASRVIVGPQYFSRLASSTEADRRARKMDMMIARPTTTSAAATTITKNAMI